MKPVNQVAELLNCGPSREAQVPFKDELPGKQTSPRHQLRGVVLRSQSPATYLIGFLLAVSTYELNAAQGSLDRFKAFLTSPGVVNNLVFQRELPPPSQQLSVTNLRPTSISWFRASWQSNAYHLVQLGPKLDQDSPTESALPQSGTFHGIYWAGSGLTCTLYYELPEGVSNQFVMAGGTSSDEYLLLEVIHFGIMELRKGTFLWNDDNSFAGSAVNKGQIKGNLGEIIDGLPRRLDYHYEKDDRLYTAALTYTNRNLPEHIPSTITISREASGNVEVLRTYTIQLLALSTDPLVAEQLDPKLLLPGERFITYSNKSYATMVAGRPVAVQESSGPKFNPRPWVYLTIITLTLAFLAIVAKKSKQNTTY